MSEGGAPAPAIRSPDMVYEEGLGLYLAGKPVRDARTGNRL